MTHSELNLSDKQLMDVLATAIISNNANLFKIVLLYIEEHTQGDFFQQKKLEVQCCLIKASGNGNLEIVQSLIDVLKKEEELNGSTLKTTVNAAYREAIINKRYNIIQFFMEQGYKYNDPNVLMDELIKGGQLELVMLYLDKEKLNFGNYEKFLDTAYANGHTNIADFFITKGVELNTALCVAAKYEESRYAVLDLIKRGADPKYNDSEPLMIAIENKNCGTVFDLIKKGVNIKAQKSRALYLAVKIGFEYRNILKELLDEIHETEYMFGNNDVERWNRMIKTAKRLLKDSNFREGSVGDPEIPTSSYIPSRQENRENNDSNSFELHPTRDFLNNGRARIFESGWYNGNYYGID